MNSCNKAKLSEFFCKIERNSHWRWITPAEMADECHCTKQTVKAYADTWNWRWNKRKGEWEKKKMKKMLTSGKF